MKKTLLIAAMVLALCVSGAWAGDGVKILGSYTDPITGQSTQFVMAERSDAVRHNQTVIYAMTTDQELVTLPNGTKRWQPTTKMAAHDNASSTGIVNGFFIGGFAGMAQGGGIAGAGALLRPSNTNVSNSNTGNGSGANISNVNQQKQGQKQGQIQSQAQVQSQAQTANPTATVNVPGGINNTNTVDIKGKNTFTASPIIQ